jgi:hypothetical protein
MLLIKKNDPFLPNNRHINFDIFAIWQLQIHLVMAVDRV